MLIDTHAHLDYGDFAPDFDDVLARARAAGVERIVTIGTSVASSRQAVAAGSTARDDLRGRRHPSTTVNEAAELDHAALRGIAGSPRVSAIGETGLDYHRLPEDADEAAGVKARQAVIFRQTTRSRGRTPVKRRDSPARRLEGYPRNPWRIHRTLAGVFHCFGGTPAQASEVLALGHLVSFTGIVTFKNGATVRETAAAVPSDRFMVETDCPYLAPVPFRGKRCEPAYTRETAAVVALARGESLETVAAQTTRNAEAFFRF